MMDVLLHAVNLTAGLTVIWGSMCALNQMCLSSSMVLRIAHVLLAVGAAAVLLAPHYLGREPTVAEHILLLGMAVLSFRLVFRRPVLRTSKEIRRIIHHLRG